MRIRISGWQDGYAALTVSKTQVQTVRHYVRDQKAHHTPTDFKTELVGLLTNHDVEYDERYLWD